VPDFNHNLLISIDYESPAVYDLVLEVSRRPDETKPEFLTRIQEKGSRQAKILKVADRISNMISLGFVTNAEFVARYADETARYINPSPRKWTSRCSGSWNPWWRPEGLPGPLPLLKRMSGGRGTPERRARREETRGGGRVWRWPRRLEVAPPDPLGQRKSRFS
jgi:hypothetical protein